MAASGASIHTIARRYVVALFSLAEEKKVLDIVAGDLEDFASMIEQSPELSRFVHNPLISRQQHQQAVQALLEKGGANALTQDFFAALAKGRRLPLVAEIARQFRTKLSELQGQVTAEVTSSMPLGKQQQNAIAKALGNVTGKEVALEMKEDPDILGGLIIKVGGKMMDNSLSGKLGRVQMAMKAQISQS